MTQEEINEIEGQFMYLEQQVNKLKSSIYQLKNYPDGIYIKRSIKIALAACNRKIYKINKLLQ